MILEVPIPTETMSFVKAMQHFFSNPPLGKKLEIVEFKALSRPDKQHLREYLIDIGYNVEPLPDPITATA